MTPDLNDQVKMSPGPKHYKIISFHSLKAIKPFSFLAKQFTLIAPTLCPGIANTERLFIIEISIKSIMLSDFYTEIDHCTVFS